MNSAPAHDVLVVQGDARRKSAPCSARLGLGETEAQCELKRGHAGDHVARVTVAWHTEDER